MSTHSPEAAALRPQRHTNLDPCQGATYHQLGVALSDLLHSAQVFLRLYGQACLAPAHTLTGWSLTDRNPQIIEALLPFFGWVYHHYFRVQTDGWEHIPPTGKVLLIGSHNGGLAAPDTVMMTYDWFQHFGTRRPAYALMDARIWQVLPGLARLATQVGTIQPHPSMATAALQQDAALLIYPGGVQDLFRPYTQRHQINFFGHRGFVKLALQESAPIVPMISYGAHATLIILANLYPLLKAWHQQGMPWPFGLDPGAFPIYLGLPWGIGVGPLPNIPFPSKLYTRVCPPITFERYGRAAAHDRSYVEACFQRVQTTMQHSLDKLVEEIEH